MSDPDTKAAITTMTAECGASSRTFKSALLWAVAEQSTSLNEDARKVLAWKKIAGESGELKLEEPQLIQLAVNVGEAERDLRETVWRSYKNIFLLGTDGQLSHIDLGLVHSDGNYAEFVIRRLKQDDIVSDSVTPNFLARGWPPALPEWSTKSVRDMFYSSPKFPRLLRADIVKDTISRGLEHGLIAYVGKASDGTYIPFVYKTSLASAQIDISDDLFIITKEAADEYVARGTTPVPSPVLAGLPPATRAGEPGPASSGITPAGTPRHPESTPPPSSEIAGFTWTGEVSPQKWMNFYTKVLSRFATAGGLRLTVTVDVAPPGGTSATKAEETKVALRELGLDETLTVKDRKPG